jgi:segregation and condensation protein B
MDDNGNTNFDDLLEDKGQDNSAKAIIEALMIATTEPLPLGNIAEIAGVPESVVRTYINDLNQEYHAAARAFEIKEIAGGFQIYTLPKYAQWVGALHKKKERLSKAALETLAIIAYHQPVIRADIEKIRGVDSTWVLDTLLQKNLIKTCGRMPSPGRPIKYGTTKEFLRYFGIKDITELPKEEDFGETVLSGYHEMPKLPPEGHETKDEQVQDNDLGLQDDNDVPEEESVDSGSLGNQESELEGHEELGEQQVDEDIDYEDEEPR